VDRFLTFTVQGIAIASVYAIAASGLVVTYTTSGIFNFAHGAFGMMAAFTYWQVHAPVDAGGWGWPTLPALLFVVLVVAPLFGALVERVVMRGLEGTSEVVKVVVSVSLMLGLLGAANWIWPADRGRSIERFFAGRQFELAGAGIPYHRVVLLVTAAVVAVALWLFLTRTRAGVAMRAVVDDRALLELNGGRPARSSMLAWSIGAGLAALSGILVAPERDLGALTLTLLVVNAYAAAVVGKLKSLPLTFVGALIVGLAEAYCAAYLTGGRELAGIDLTNLRFAVSPIILFAVMVAQPQARLRTGGIQRVREQWRVPSVRQAAAGGAVLVVALWAVTELIDNDADRLPLVPGMFFALVALSLVPLTGFAGQISLAQMSFVGMGAVVMSAVSESTGKTPAALIVALAVCGVLGAIVALPALRLSGIYLALATAAFSLFLTQMFFNQISVMPGGSRNVPGLDLGVVEIRSNQSQVLMLGVTFAAVGTFVVWLRRSSFGRRLTAMKDSPVACATLGLDLTRTKIGVFALSASIAGLAGALANRTVTSTDFELTTSMTVTMLAVVGGVGVVSGALFGGLLIGAFNTVVPRIMAQNAIGVFGFVEVAVPDLMKVAPGLIGVSLGRDPTGAAPQIAEGFRPLTRSRQALSIVGGAAAVLWLLARSDTISNWTFVACLVLLAGVAPLIPVLLAPIPGGRAAWAGAAIVAAMVGVGAVEWETFIDSVGLRVVLMVLAAVVAANVAALVHGAVPGMGESRSPRPDLIGVDRPLGASDALEAERVLGVAGILGSRDGAA